LKKRLYKNLLKLKKNVNAIYQTKYTTRGHLILDISGNL
jgi:hypothetical protein